MSMSNYGVSKTKCRIVYRFLTHFLNNEEKPSASVYINTGKHMCNEQ